LEKHICETPEVTSEADNASVIAGALVVGFVDIVPVGGVLSSLIPLTVVCGIGTVFDALMFHVLQYSSVLALLSVVIAGCPFAVTLLIEPPFML
jgi:hypothetical protein